MSINDKELINLLKKFPDENPNPVIRISKDGILEYFNTPSKHIIKYYGLSLKEKIPDQILTHLNQTLRKSKHNFELKINSSSFQFKAIYIEGLQSVNIYGTDITAKKVIDKFPDSNPNPVIRINYKGIVKYFREKNSLDAGWINGGFFVCNPDVMEYLEDDTTVFERKPLEGLAKDGKLAALKHTGFWKPMDTLRDKNQLESKWNNNLAPWKTW